MSPRMSHWLHGLAEALIAATFAVLVIAVIVLGVRSALSLALGS